jgi:hypothetical protein
MIHYYRMVDNKKKNPMILTDYDKLEYWNKQNYGIFWSINSFKNGKRTADNLIKINAWAVDIDEGTKEEQLIRIEKAPLHPSMLIETKSGYHVYWFSRDATEENYKNIVERRLVYFFNSDVKAKDICRVLRVPNFYHCKDIDNKFLIKLVYKNKLSYFEREMMSFFKPKPIEIKIQKEQRFIGNDFWTKASSMDCEIALCTLSGTEAVGMEQIEVNKKQIFVNGSSTSSWIDENGYIGSYDNGGPSIANWIWWYHRDWKKVAELLKKYFPELRDEK